MKHIYLQDFRFIKDGDPKSVCDSFWMEYQGGEYLFKYNIMDTNLNLGERFYSIACSKLGVDVTNTEIVSCNRNKYKTRGILVKSYLGKNDFSRSLLDVINAGIQNNYKYCVKAHCSVESIIEIMSVYAKENNLYFDIQRAKEFLVKMCVIDYFFCQNDRHYRNIEIIQRGKQIAFAPIFNNGECFAFGLTNIKVRNLVNCGWDSEKQPHYFTSLLNGDWSMQPKEILTYCKKNEKIAKLVNSILKLDFDEILTQIEDENGEKINDSLKNLTKSMFNSRKEKFIKTYNNSINFAKNKTI